MSILVFSATEREIAPFRKWLDRERKNDSLPPVKCILTGPGILSSCYHITSALLQHKPVWAIQAGIAGTFSDQIELGETVIVKEEIIGDCGVHESGRFIDLFELGLMNNNHFPFHEKKLPNPAAYNWSHLQLPVVRGVTVNQITTETTTINYYRSKLGCEIESMEGACLHYAALHLNIPFLQVRSVSNEVGMRDKSKWQMNAAIDSVNEALIRIIQSL